MDLRNLSDLFGQKFGGGTEREPAEAAGGPVCAGAVLPPEMTVVCVREDADMKRAADLLIGGSPVLLNMQSTGRASMRRYIDCLSGILYARGGQITPISSGVFFASADEDLEFGGAEEMPLPQSPYGEARPAVYDYDKDCANAV